MQAAPFRPVSQQEGEQLEMFALKRALDRLETRLLPACTGFAILEHLVTADETSIIEHQLAALDFGPEHEGRVAIRSPSHGDRA